MGVNNEKKTGYNNELKGTIRKTEGLIEICILTLVYYLIWRVLYRETGAGPLYGRGKIVLALVYAIFLVITIKMCEGFQFGHRRYLDVVLSQWIGVVITNIMTYLQLSLTANRMINIGPISILTASDVLLSALFCYIYHVLYYKHHASRNMLMIYGMDQSAHMESKFLSRPEQFRVSNRISDDTSFEYIVQEIRRYDAVILSDVKATLRNDIVKYCYENRIRTYISPKLSDIILRGAPEVTLFDTPLVLVRGYGLSFGQRIIKRTLDIVLCAISMIVVLPIMIVIAIAIKIEDGGSVLYRQERVTKDGKTFQILKFRSMIEDAEKDGAQAASTDDPRITKVGKVLRRSRLDELPQVFNILTGSMSIVGPRPERTEYNERYRKEIPEFSYRLKVQAGLTGYAQVYGKYNTSAYDKLRLDLMYIENYSLLLDIQLIFRTIRVLFMKDATEGFENALLTDGGMQEENDAN